MKERKHNCLKRSRRRCEVRSIVQSRSNRLKTGVQRALVGVLLLSALPALAERYVCPVSLLDEGLVQLTRDGSQFELLHSVLGRQPAALVGESRRHFCASATLFNRDESPTLYLFCVDKQEKTIAATFGSPFGEKGLAALPVPIDAAADADSDSTQEDAQASAGQPVRPPGGQSDMAPWTHALCFVTNQPE